LGSFTRCRKRTCALLLLLLLSPAPRLLLLLVLLPVTMATPSAGLIPSLSRMAGVIRERYPELSMRKSIKPAPAHGMTSNSKA
jgi:hypothetical protein